MKARAWEMATPPKPYSCQGKSSARVIRPLRPRRMMSESANRYGGAISGTSEMIRRGLLRAQGPRVVM
jgi:hypothetical protein